jgi:Flp pilus assembly protein TadG
VRRDSVAEEKGQVLVMASIGMLALVAMLLFVINAGALLLSYRTLTRTAEHAATAAVRSLEAGDQQMDEAKAREEAEKVLDIELGGVRFMQEPPSDVAATLDLIVHNTTNDTVVVNGQTYHGPVVEVSLDAHLCPPVWPCIPVEGHGMTALETSNQPAAVATSVPQEHIEITPTPD